MNSDPFAPNLLRGETILWSGRPHQGILLTSQDDLLIPLSLLWGGFFFFFGETTALQPNRSFPMALFGLPFVLVGLFLIGGRFLLDALLRSKTFYALTNRRVLIARAAPWPAFKALGLERLPEITFSEGSNRRGTITFGTQGSGMMNGRALSGSWVAALDSRPRFLNIEDARHVFVMIQDRMHVNE